MVTATGDAALDGLLWRQVDANRGIPEAIFIENVEALCKERKPTDVVARLQDLYSKYQYMQSSIVAQRSGLKTKLPDIASALETVNHLIAKRDNSEGVAQEYSYQLAENIWAKASADSTNSVCLWLGANCMLEYSLEEAVELLRTNETNAKTMLKSLNEDMAFLRDQTTTTEVNIARCHNHGVKLRQKAKDSADAAVPAAPVAVPRALGPKVEEQKRSAEPWTYTWKQDGDEVEVSVALPAGAVKNDLKVSMLAESLKIEHCGKVVLDGQFAGKCSPNGSTWTMAMDRVDLSLEKGDSSTWSSLFEEV